MRRFLPLFIFIFLSSFARAQYVYIPDLVLRENLQQQTPGCMSGSMLDTACAATITSLSIDLTIDNWQGFQYFKNLQTLSLMEQSHSYPALPSTLQKLSFLQSDSITAIPALPAGLKWLKVDALNSLTSLPTLPAALKHLEVRGVVTSLPSLPAGLTYLDVSLNYLSSLPALPSTLDTLNCSDNRLVMQFYSLPPGLKYFNCSDNLTISSLGSLPSTLKYLDCSLNEALTGIPALPGGLEYLDAGHCNISAVPALPSGLTHLNISTNHVNALPSLPNSLRILDCSYNQLSSIPNIPGILGTLDCSFNQITALPVVAFPATMSVLACNDNLLNTLPAIPNSNTIQINCENNRLTSLPALPSNLRRLYCQNNLLTSLPTLPPLMEDLRCNQNQLSALPKLPGQMQILFCAQNNITCLPFLPQDLFEIWMDSTIQCIPNRPIGCSFMSPGTWGKPICNPVNNPDHCEVFPTMTGYVFSDINNNQAKDPGEPGRPFVRVYLQDGNAAYTDNNGFYTIVTNTLGNHTLSTELPTYFAAVPPSYTYNFSSYDTIVANNFALQPLVSLDSMSAFITPATAFARPGFPFAYLVQYENAGTTLLSPSIVLNYNNTRLIYDSSSNASVINTGNSLQLSQPSMVWGERKSFIAYFHINAASHIGDSIISNVQVTASGINITDTNRLSIRGSYDPNDKTATPVMTTAEVVAGKYIYYTINFQNTGTDTAFNIVITDTLNSNLQKASLQIINTSHLCHITENNGILYFEFTNILLPDSNVNEKRSHGYINFRIKPELTVISGTDIPNKAAIYFDFNSPVITNTAITHIQDAIVVPLKLLSFNAVRQTKTTANVYWNTANEINVQHFVIETSTDGRNYTSAALENAKGDVYNNYTKIITIADKDIIYLRLKMIDIDGHYSYSPVVILKNNTNEAFSFLENPAKNILAIALKDEALKNTVARIVNAQGAVVKSFLFQNDLEYIDIRNLSSGTYILQTKKGNSRFVVRN